MANRCQQGIQEHSMTLGVRKMKLLGVATVALLAMGASGCSSLPTVPDWVDPTTWFGGSDEPVDNAQTPDLASVPDAPVAPAADEQQKVAESLSADRNNAKYSAEALRGGSEPAAAPPPDLPAEKVAEDAPVAPKAKAPAAPAPTQVAAVDRSLAQDPAGTTTAGTLPPPPAGAPVTAVAAAPEAVKTAELAEPAPAPAPVKPAKKVKAKPVQVAEAAPPPRVTPAPEPQAVPQAPVNSVSPSDAELGFKPSSAPPLDPSVSQFVAAPIVNHYRATASNAGMRSGPSGYAAATPRHKAVRHRAPATDVAMGGPEKMEGKVVANLDTLGSAPAVQPMANVNGANAVVYFPGDAVALNAAAKLQVRAAAEQFKAAGGQGYVRVVGHSSSRTPNMSAEKHLELIFKKSQARANAVARELIRAGIPADKVLVEAVGDTQPVFYESMPKGEDGNRRAEIFLQG
jgi:outer membrane protein OmpA-like peptidoglycan-associated protein